MRLIAYYKPSLETNLCISSFVILNFIHVTRVTVLCHASHTKQTTELHETREFKDVLVTALIQHLYLFGNKSQTETIHTKGLQNSSNVHPVGKVQNVAVTRVTKFNLLQSQCT